MISNMLSCIDLSIEILGKKIVSNLGLSLLPGAIYVLKGANGSGKTSFLKTLAGINENYQGKILWNNKSIEKDVFFSYIISYLGHENALKEDLSVIDNLNLWADFKGNHLLIAPSIVQFDLAEHLEKKCKYLSAGLKKRVALARMIISNGMLWLLDEPESNLDDKGMELLLKLLQAKINSGGIVIIASHNLEHYKKVPVIQMEDFKDVQ